MECGGSNIWNRCRSDGKGGSSRMEAVGQSPPIIRVFYPAGSRRGSVWRQRAASLSRSSTTPTAMRRRGGRGRMAGRRKGVFKRCRMRGYGIETGQRRKNQQKFPEIPRETLVNYSSKHECNIPVSFQDHSRKKRAREPRGFRVTLSYFVLKLLLVACGVNLLPLLPHCLLLRALYISLHSATLLPRFSPRKRCESSILASSDMLFPLPAR